MGGQEGVGWVLGAAGKLKAGYTIHKETDSSNVFSVGHLVGRNGSWQQSDKTCSLISTPQWLHRPCSRPSWFYRVGKRPPVKADLAIYSPVSGVSGV